MAKHFALTTLAIMKQHKTSSLKKSINLLPQPPHHRSAQSVPYFTPAHIENAYQWLIRQRCDYPDNADIWDLRFHWPQMQARILSAVNTRSYVLSPLQIVKKASGESVALWSSSDALVLKMLTGILETQLPVHPLCEHVRGHGGGRQSALRVDRHLRERQAPFVFRTDIKGYYATIDKTRLYDQLCRHISHPVLLNLLWQFLHYSVEQGGNFHTPHRGISRGSALSPLLAAFHLYETDLHFEKRQPRVRYARYMDDFLILAPTRWLLRRAVRDLKRQMAEYGFILHPDKTQLGYIAQGFDWMGLWFEAGGMQTIAPRAVSKHRQKCRRLYEQIRNLSTHAQEARMAQYRRRWIRALVPPGQIFTVSEHILMQHRGNRLRA
ncbi:TPA: reverse transcriptase domain-containing protein [Serratia marcescens]